MNASIVFKITTITLLSIFTSDAFSQNSIYAFSGPNLSLVSGYKNDKFFKTTNKFGYIAGMGVERKIKNNSASLEISFAINKFEMKAGPYFFPGDLPTGSGSFYNTKYSIKNINITPIFRYNLIKKRLYIPLGVGLQKSFPTVESELITPDRSSESQVIFYQIPNVNISINAGLTFFINKTNRPSVFISSRYSRNLISIKPQFPGYKKINISSISVLLGISI